MTAPRPEVSGVLAPPPLIFLGFLIAGWGLGRLVGEPSLGLDAPIRRGLAIAGLVIGFGIEGWAVGLFRRARTAPEPWKPTTALVTDGVYRFTRNPIYLGFAVTFLGLAIGLDSPLTILFLLPCLVVIDRFVIQREERYLAGLFGAAYDAYRGRVRRWL
ncbi:methyltransferase family protein [Brevundimonas sp. TWP2-3-2]|uniref:methyltransferase family protein n=1 Tax=unclassified Brevundimonas TaxID=2622653 RepID=UPI003CECBE0F